MKISGGLKQGDIVVGNAYNKYASPNPLAQALMSFFFRSLDALVAKAAPQTIHEIGCGEGFLTLRWQARGSDFSDKVIELARENAMTQGVSTDIFNSKSVYSLSPQKDGADLIVCCEVLEHLERPRDALESMRLLASKFVILSVPREPLWCPLNFLRGKYVTSWGNTPGHIQHWSTRSFIQLAHSFFVIEEVRTPLPWTMLLCSPKDNVEE